MVNLHCLLCLVELCEAGMILEHPALHENLSSKTKNVQPMFAAEVVLFRNCFKEAFLAMKVCEVLSICGVDKAVLSEWRRVDPALAGAGPLNAVLGQGLGRLGGIYTRCCLGSLLTLSTQQTTCVFFAAGQFNIVTEYNCNALLRWLWSSVLITIST